MPKGPHGQKRPADAIGRVIHVAKIATGEIEDDAPTTATPQNEGGKKGGATRVAAAA